MAHSVGTGLTRGRLNGKIPQESAKLPEGTNPRKLAEQIRLQGEISKMLKDTTNHYDIVLLVVSLGCILGSIVLGVLFGEKALVTLWLAAILFFVSSIFTYKLNS